MENVSVQPETKHSNESGAAPGRYGGIAGSGNVVSDEELVRKSLNGEEDAFRLLYERYRNLVYNAVCRILRDPEEARDAMQDTFILVYRSLGFWNPQRARLAPWIYRVATNHAIDHWRSRKRTIEAQMLQTIEMESGGDFMRREAIRTFNSGMEQMEQSVRVLRIMDRLPEIQKRFIILRYCEGLKLKEIAEKEGCKLGTVKSTLHRATEAMRSKMKFIYN